MVMATSLLECTTNQVSFNTDANYLAKPAKNRHFVGEEQYHGVCSPKQLIGDALRRRVENIDHEFCEPGDEDTFFVADLGEVYRQHMRWKLNLPRVKPFYAVKCNPDPTVLRLLSQLGTGFDCASKGEIEQVLGLGVPPERIIYAQPCKTNSYVRYVASQGVSQMTFDNADELRKIARVYPGADLFLRIHTDDSSSLCRLSLKFGAEPAATNELLATARSLGLNVVGVSFHVGSGASDPAAFIKAVRDARTVFDQAATHGYKLRTVDVGGGFCPDDSFETMATVLRDALDDHFPASSGINLIAEPGRYYVSSAFTIACNVIARRTVDDHADPTIPSRYMVYLNDGLYGNFSSIMFDHQNPIARVLRAGSRFVYEEEDADIPTPISASSSDAGCIVAPNVVGLTEYSIWGPTCDGIDRISDSIHFSYTLDVGDWLYFEDMGAYTKCSATRFNGFKDDHDVIYVCSEAGARALLEC